MTDVKFREDLRSLKKNLECPVCLDIIKDPVATECEHHFCRCCIMNAFSYHRKKRVLPCPICYRDITKRSLSNSDLQDVLLVYQNLLNTFDSDAKDHSNKPTKFSQKRRVEELDSDDSSFIFGKNRKNLRQAKRRKAENGVIIFADPDVEEQTNQRLLISTNTNVHSGFPKAARKKSVRGKRSPSHPGKNAANCVSSITRSKARVARCLQENKENRVQCASVLEHNTCNDFLTEIDNACRVNEEPVRVSKQAAESSDSANDKLTALEKKLETLLPGSHNKTVDSLPNTKPSLKTLHPADKKNKYKLGSDTETRCTLQVEAVLLGNGDQTDLHESTDNERIEFDKEKAIGPINSLETKYSAYGDLPEDNGLHKMPLSQRTPETMKKHLNRRSSLGLTRKKHRAYSLVVHKKQEEERVTTPEELKQLINEISDAENFSLPVASQIVQEKSNVVQKALQATVEKRGPEDKKVKATKAKTKTVRFSLRDNITINNVSTKKAVVENSSTFTVRAKGCVAHDDKTIHMTSSNSGCPAQFTIQNSSNGSEFNAVSNEDASSCVVSASHKLPDDISVSSPKKLLVAVDVHRSNSATDSNNTDASPTADEISKCLYMEKQATKCSFAKKEVIIKYPTVGKKATRNLATNKKATECLSAESETVKPVEVITHTTAEKQVAKYSLAKKEAINDKKTTAVPATPDDACQLKKNANSSTDSADAMIVSQLDNEVKGNGFPKANRGLEIYNYSLGPVRKSRKRKIVKNSRKKKNRKVTPKVTPTIVTTIVDDIEEDPYAFPLSQKSPLKRETKSSTNSSFSKKCKKRSSYKKIPTRRSTRNKNKTGQYSEEQTSSEEDDDSDNDDDNIIDLTDGQKTYSNDHDSLSVCTKPNHVVSEQSGVSGGECLNNEISFKKTDNKDESSEPNAKECAESDSNNDNDSHSENCIVQHYYRAEKDKDVENKDHSLLPVSDVNAETVDDKIAVKKLDSHCEDSCFKNIRTYSVTKRSKRKRHLSTHKVTLQDLGAVDMPHKRGEWLNTDEMAKEFHVKSKYLEISVETKRNVKDVKAVGSLTSGEENDVESDICIDIDTESFCTTAVEDASNSIVKQAEEVRPSVVLKCCTPNKFAEKHTQSSGKEMNALSSVEGVAAEGKTGRAENETLKSWHQTADLISVEQLNDAGINNVSGKKNAALANNKEMERVNFSEELNVDANRNLMTSASGKGYGKCRLRLIENISHADCDASLPGMQESCLVDSAILDKEKKDQSSGTSDDVIAPSVQRVQNKCHLSDTDFELTKRQLPVSDLTCENHLHFVSEVVAHIDEMYAKDVEERTICRSLQSPQDSSPSSITGTHDTLLEIPKEKLTPYDNQIKEGCGRASVEVEDIIADSVAHFPSGSINSNFNTKFDVKQECVSKVSGKMAKKNVGKEGASLKTVCEEVQKIGDIMEQQSRNLKAEILLKETNSEAITDIETKLNTSHDSRMTDTSLKMSEKLLDKQPQSSSKKMNASSSSDDFVSPSRSTPSTDYSAPILFKHRKDIHNASNSMMSELSGSEHLSSDECLQVKRKDRKSLRRRFKKVTSQQVNSEEELLIKPGRAELHPFKTSLEVTECIFQRRDDCENQQCDANQHINIVNCQTSDGNTNDPEVTSASIRNVISNERGKKEPRDDEVKIALDDFGIKLCDGHQHVTDNQASDGSTKVKAECSLAEPQVVFPDVEKRKETSLAHCEQSQPCETSKSTLYQSDDLSSSQNHLEGTKAISSTKNTTSFTSTLCQPMRNVIPFLNFMQKSSFHPSRFKKQRDIESDPTLLTNEISRVKQLHNTAVQEQSLKRESGFHIKEVVPSNSNTVGYVVPSVSNIQNRQLSVLPPTNSNLNNAAVHTDAVLKDQFALLASEQLCPAALSSSSSSVSTDQKRKEPRNYEMKITLDPMVSVQEKNLQTTMPAQTVPSIKKEETDYTSKLEKSQPQVTESPIGFSNKSKGSDYEKLYHSVSGSSTVTLSSTETSSNDALVNMQEPSATGQTLNHSGSAEREPLPPKQLASEQPDIEIVMVTDEYRASIPVKSQRSLKVGLENVNIENELVVEQSCTSSPDSRSCVISPTPSLRTRHKSSSQASAKNECEVTHVLPHKGVDQTSIHFMKTGDIFERSDLSLSQKKTSTSNFSEKRKKEIPESTASIFGEKETNSNKKSKDASFSSCRRTVRGLTRRARVMGTKLDNVKPASTMDKNDKKVPGSSNSEGSIVRKSGTVRHLGTRDSIDVIRKRNKTSSEEIDLSLDLVDENIVTTTFQKTDFCRAIADVLSVKRADAIDSSLNADTSDELKMATDLPDLSPRRLTKGVRSLMPVVALSETPDVLKSPESPAELSVDICAVLPHTWLFSPTEDIEDDSPRKNLATPSSTCSFSSRKNNNINISCRKKSPLEVSFTPRAQRSDPKRTRLQLGAHKAAQVDVAKSNTGFENEDTDSSSLLKPANVLDTPEMMARIFANIQADVTGVPTPKKLNFEDHGSSKLKSTPKCKKEQEVPTINDDEADAFVCDNAEENALTTPYIDDGINSTASEQIHHEIVLEEPSCRIIQTLSSGEIVKIEQENLKNTDQEGSGKQPIFLVEELSCPQQLESMGFNLEDKSDKYSGTAMNNLTSVSKQSSSKKLIPFFGECDEEMEICSKEQDLIVPKVLSTDDPEKQALKAQITLLQAQIHLLQEQLQSKYQCDADANDPSRQIKKISKTVDEPILHNEQTIKTRFGDSVASEETKETVHHPSSLGKNITFDNETKNQNACKSDLKDGSSFEFTSHCNHTEEKTKKQKSDNSSQKSDDRKQVIAFEKANSIELMADNLHDHDICDAEFGDSVPETDINAKLAETHVNSICSRLQKNESKESNINPVCILDMNFISPVKLESPATLDSNLSDASSIAGTELQTRCDVKHKFNNNDDILVTEYGENRRENEKNTINSGTSDCKVVNNSIINGNGNLSNHILAAVTVSESKISQHRTLHIKDPDLHTNSNSKISANTSVANLDKNDDMTDAELAAVISEESKLNDCSPMNDFLEKGPESQKVLCEALDGHLFMRENKSSESVKNLNECVLSTSYFTEGDEIVDDDLAAANAKDNDHYGFETDHLSNFHQDVSLEKMSSTENHDLHDALQTANVPSKVELNCSNSSEEDSEELLKGLDFDDGEPELCDADMTDVDAVAGDNVDNDKTGNNADEVIATEVDLFVNSPVHEFPASTALRLLTDVDIEPNAPDFSFEGKHRSTSSVMKSATPDFHYVAETPKKVITGTKKKGAHKQGNGFTTSLVSEFRESKEKENAAEVETTQETITSSDKELTDALEEQTELEDIALSPWKNSGAESLKENTLPQTDENNKGAADKRKDFSQRQDDPYNLTDSQFVEIVEKKETHPLVKQSPGRVSDTGEWSPRCKSTGENFQQGSFTLKSSTADDRTEQYRHTSVSSVKAAMSPSIHHRLSLPNRSEKQSCHLNDSPLAFTLGRALNKQIIKPSPAETLSNVKLETAVINEKRQSSDADGHAQTPLVSEQQSYQLIPDLSSAISGQNPVPDPSPGASTLQEQDLMESSSNGKLKALEKRFSTTEIGLSSPYLPNSSPRAVPQFKQIISPGIQLHGSSTPAGIKTTCLQKSKSPLVVNTPATNVLKQHENYSSTVSSSSPHLMNIWRISPLSEKRVLMTPGQKTTVAFVANKENVVQGHIEPASLIQASQSGKRCTASQVQYCKDFEKSQPRFVFVTSGLMKKQALTVRAFAERIGAEIVPKFTLATTHVIIKADEDRVCDRTLKYFQGIAARRWVVSCQWVEDSLSVGRLLSEVDYEIRGDTMNGRSHYGPERARQTTTLLMENIVAYCFGSFTTMLPRDQLCELLRYCGATVVELPEILKEYASLTPVIIVEKNSDDNQENSALYQKFGVPVVHREWVLDSVSTYMLKERLHYVTHNL